MENFVRNIDSFYRRYTYIKQQEKIDNFCYADKLSDEGHAVHSPRISPNGEYLVWLQREAGVVPHHNAHALVLRDLKRKNSNVRNIMLNLKY